VSATSPVRPSFVTRAFERHRRVAVVDGLAAALAFSLPWSTSATSILVALWLLAYLGTADKSSLRRALSCSAGTIPPLLVLLLVLGTAWAFGVPAGERWDGVRSLSKLLVIPLLIAHFQVSERGDWVFKAFLASCMALLVLSWVLVLAPSSLVPLWGHSLGVPVKDYIAQANEFTVCAFLLGAVSLMACRQRRRALAVAAALTAAAFVLNVLLVATSRTALVVIPVLLVLFTLKFYSRRAMATILVIAAVVAGLAWSLAPTVRDNVNGVLKEVMTFESAGGRTRAGERLEYWRKSLGFVAEAPLLGHGTGSIPLQFRRASAGQIGMAALASENPHNQTLAVAIQLGLLGTVVLFAMWIVHLRVFRGDDLVNWTGLVVVTQNIVSSLFNSHLADFTQGWGYVLGVGIAAGMVLRWRTSGEAHAENRQRKSVKPI
jgi:O-antigen ligase